MRLRCASSAVIFFLAALTAGAANGGISGNGRAVTGRAANGSGCADAAAGAWIGKLYIIFTRKISCWRFIL